MKTPIYFVVPVWGEPYVRVFLDIVLPAQLSDNNLPVLAGRKDCRYDIYTSQLDYPTIVNSPAFKMLAALVPASVHITDAPTSMTDANWGERYTKKSECYRHAIQRAAQNDAANFMLNADIVLADGFIKRVVELLDAGKRVIELPGPRALRAPLSNTLRREYGRPDGTIQISPRELTNLTMKYLHPLMNMHLWGPPDVGAPFHPSHLYFRTGKRGILARCFHLYPIVVHPRDIEEALRFDTTIDDDLVEKAAPDLADTHLVTDSDDMFCCELSPPDHYVGSMGSRGNFSQMVDFYQRYGKTRNWDLLDFKLRLRADDVSEEEWVKAEKESDQVVARIRAVRNERLAKTEDRPKARFLLAVWGKRHIDIFLNYALPTLLAPGNIPTVSQKYQCTFEILTLEEDYGHFREHWAMPILGRYADAQLTSIDDITVKHSYGVMLTMAFARGIKAQRDAMTDTTFIFLNADFIFSDGALAAVVNAMAEGYSGVLAPSFRCISEDFFARMHGSTDALNPVLSMSGRELVKLGIELIHPTFISKTMNQDEVFTLLANQFLWKVDEDCYLARFLLMFMLCIKPEKPLDKVIGYCDYTFVPELIPSGNFKTFTDSDDIFILELQHRDHEGEFFLPERPTPQYLAGRVSEWATPLHRSYGELDLLFHTKDVPARIGIYEKQATQFMGELSVLLDPPQPYRDHQYWTGTFAALQMTPEDFVLLPPEGLKTVTLFHGNGLFPSAEPTPQFVLAAADGAAQSPLAEVPAAAPAAAPTPVGPPPAHIPTEPSILSLAARCRQVVTRRYNGEDVSGLALLVAQLFLAGHGAIRGLLLLPMAMFGFTLVRKRDLRHLEGMYDTANNDRQREYREKAALVRELDRRSGLLVAAERRGDDLAKAVEGAQQQLAAIAGDLAGVKATLVVTERRASSVEKARNDLEGALSAERATCANLRQGMCQLESLAVKGESEAARGQAELKDLRAALEAEQDALAECKLVLAEAEEAAALQAKRFEDERAEAEEAAALRTTRLAGELATAHEAALEQARRHEAELAVARSVAEQTIAIVQSSANALSLEVHRHRAEAAVAEAALANLRAELADRDALLASARGARRKAVAEAEEYRGRLEGVEAALSVRQAQQKAIAAELEGERARTVTMLDEVNDARRKIAETAEETRSVLDEIHRHKQWYSATMLSLANERVRLRSSGGARVALGGRKKITWLASFPKAGNTWVRSMLVRLLFGGEEALLDMQGVLPDLLGAVDPEALRQLEPAILKAHDMPAVARAKVGAMVGDFDCQASIYIGRNPLDIIVSWFDFMVLNGAIPAVDATGARLQEFALQFADNALPEATRSVIPPYKLNEHVVEWTEEVAKTGGVVIRYEDLLDDTVGQLLRITDCLGLTVDPRQLVAVVEACRFDQLRAIEDKCVEHAMDFGNEFFREHRSEAYRDGRRFFNRGEVGRGRRMLTPETIAVLERKLEPAFSLLGYQVGVTQA